VSPGIFVVRDGGDLVEMAEQPYASENVLQKLLAEYPSLLVGDKPSSEDPRKYVLVKREAGLPSQEGGGNRWSVDHLFLDQDGTPTLVEVKRSSNTQIRREVVGQMLDYAANAVVYWPVEKIRSEFEANSLASGIDPEDALRSLLEEGGDPEAFWQKVKTSLEAGKVRLVFVTDAIPVELQRIVEFLNEQMNSAEVLALEVKEFSGEGMKTLVSRVIGQTAAARQAKGIREPSGKGKLYHEFWSDFLPHLHERYPGWSRSQRPSATWIELPAGRSGIYYAADFPKERVRVELYVDPLQPGLREGAAYRKLEEHKQEIEAAFGGPLSWEPLEGKRASRIATYRDGAIEGREQWPEYQQWLLQNLGRLRQAIQSFVDALG
jgi:Domain of unknown function (DUF4268)